MAVWRNWAEVVVVAEKRRIRRGMIRFIGIILRCGERFWKLGGERFVVDCGISNFLSSCSNKCADAWGRVHPPATPGNPF
jgi:hypothetical protein